MNADELRALQAPLKERYTADAAAAMVTLRARGTTDDAGVSCSVETGKALAVAGGALTWRGPDCPSHGSVERWASTGQCRDCGRDRSREQSRKNGIRLVGDRLAPGRIALQLLVHLPPKTIFFEQERRPLPEIVIEADECGRDALLPTSLGDDVRLMRLKPARPLSRTFLTATTL
jgi:hypothetical protein